MNKLIEHYEKMVDGAKRTELGLKQFNDYESKGLTSKYPDPYFWRLLNGKKWFEWILLICMILLIGLVGVY